MSTKCSYYYDSKNEIHVYYELMDMQSYIETDEGRVLIPKGMAERLKEAFENYELLRSKR